MSDMLSAIQAFFHQGYDRGLPLDLFLSPSFSTWLAPALRMQVCMLSKVIMRPLLGASPPGRCFIVLTKFAEDILRMSCKSAVSARCLYKFVTCQEPSNSRSPSVASTPMRKGHVTYMETCRHTDILICRQGDRQTNMDTYVKAVPMQLLHGGRMDFSKELWPCECLYIMYVRLHANKQANKHTFLHTYINLLHFADHHPRLAPATLRRHPPPQRSV